MRRAVEFAVLLVVGLTFSRVWFIESSIVTTGSMYPALVGTHVDLVCAECGLPRILDADYAELPAVCSRCGAVRNNTEALPVIDGDGLLINRAAFMLRDPRRWEVAAFRCPHRPSRLCIKRVVGLPGEKVEIRAGDLYINGQIARKTLSQQRALAVPVDDANQSRSGERAPPRWRPAGGSTRWQASSRNGVLRFVRAATTLADVADAEPIDWLTYHHHRSRWDAADEGMHEATITDVQPYNKDHARHAFDTVDVLWTCRVRAVGHGKLLFRAGDGTDDFLVRIDVDDGLVELLHNGRPVEQVGPDLNDFASTADVEMSLIDRQFLFAVAGQPWFRSVSLPADSDPDGRNGGGSARSVIRPFAIAAQGPEVEVGDLRIFRDAYYTPLPTGLVNQPPRRSVTLANGEFFVLGDNSAASADSRSWLGGAAVAANDLVGKPVIVDRPNRLINVGGRHFQVPDLGKIRYIR